MVLLIIILFLGIVLYLGIPGKAVRSTSVSDHVIAGRSLGLWPIFFIGVAEFYSAGTFLGFPGWGLWLRCASFIFFSCHRIKFHYGILAWSKSNGGWAKSWSWSLKLSFCRRDIRVEH